MVISSVLFSNFSFVDLLVLFGISGFLISVMLCMDVLLLLFLCGDKGGGFIGVFKDILFVLGVDFDSLVISVILVMLVIIIFFSSSILLVNVDFKFDVFLQELMVVLKGQNNLLLGLFLVSFMFFSDSSISSVLVISDISSMSSSISLISIDIIVCVYILGGCLLLLGGGLEVDFQSFIFSFFGSSSGIDVGLGDGIVFLLESVFSNFFSFLGVLLFMILFLSFL